MPDFSVGHVAINGKTLSRHDHNELLANLLSHLANQAPLVNLTPEQEDRVMVLIAEIRAIFNEQMEKLAA